MRALSAVLDSSVLTGFTGQLSTVRDSAQYSLAVKLYRTALSDDLAQSRTISNAETLNPSGNIFILLKLQNKG